MKKKIKSFMMMGLFTIIGSLTFMSCSDTEDTLAAQRDASNQIHFTAEVQNTLTRATPVTSDNYKSLMKDFYVTAGFLNPSNGTSNWFFTNEVFTGDGNGVYSPASPYYWGDNDLEFTAVSPASSEVTVSNNAAGVASVTYTVPYDQSKQIDLMVAYGKGNRETNNGNVPLPFKHVLSQVRFAATSSSSVSANIKSVKIHNIFNIVSASLVKGSLKVSTSPKSSQENSYGIGLASPKSIDGTTKVSLYDDNGILLLPPQVRNAASFAGKGISSDFEITSGYAFLEIECNIKDKAHNKYIVGGEGSYSRIYVPVAVNWEPGKCYTYVINFTGGDGFGYDEDGYPIASVVKMDVSVDNWQNADDTVKTI